MPIDPLGDPELTGVQQQVVDPLGDPELAGAPQSVQTLSGSEKQVFLPSALGLLYNLASPRQRSLFVQGETNAIPFGNRVASKVMPEINQLAPAENMGEKLVQAGGGVMGMLPSVVGGGTILSKVPGLASKAGGLNVLGEAALGGAYGASVTPEGGDVLANAGQNALMFPIAGMAGKLGGVAGRALTPISKEVGVDVGTGLVTGASGLTKIFGLVPAEMISTTAAHVGAGLGSAVVGYVFSNGELSDAIVMGVMGGMGAEGNKTKVRMGLVEPKLLTYDVDTVNKLKGLEESKYHDLKQGQKEVAAQYGWEKMAGRYNVSPGAKEVQPIRDLVFMAEDARMRGDIDLCNDMYIGAEKGLAELMQTSPIPLEGGTQTPLKSSADLAMEKLNPPNPTLSKPKEVSPKVPESGSEARARREGEAKIIEHINTPDGVLRSIAKEQAMTEALQRMNGQGQKNSAISQEAKQIVASGQEQINASSSVDPQVKAEVDMIMPTVLTKTEPMGGGTRVLNAGVRLFADMDRALGGGIGQGVEYMTKLWDRTTKTILKIQETESKIYLQLEKALETAGFKKNALRNVLGGHLFDKTMREQYTAHRLNLFSDEKLGKLGYSQEQINNLREAVRKLSPQTIETFTKTDGILGQVFDQYYSKMSEFYTKQGKKLSYEEDFFPFYMDNTNTLTPSEYGATSPYQLAKEKSWKHRQHKYEIPENLIDPITAATRYIRESEMKMALDPLIKQYTYMRDTALNGIKQTIIGPDGRPREITIAEPRTDIAKIFTKVVDSMAPNGYLDDIGELLNTKPGRILTQSVSKMLGQVVLTTSTVVNSMLSFVGPTGSEVGVQRFWKHVAKSVANPMFLGAAKESATMKSRLYINDNHIVNTKNYIEHFFSAANVHADRIVIKAAYNAAYEYASETLFKHLNPITREAKSHIYADAFADRSQGIFNKILKPSILNQKWANIMMPFQTTAMASAGMFWHDTALNKSLTPQVKAQRMGVMLATGIMARLALSVLKGEPDNPTSSIQKAVLDQIPIIGDFNRLGGGISGFMRLLQKPTLDTALRTTIQYAGPRGSYAVYRTFSGLKTILDDGIVRDSKGGIMYQFDTSDPAEILRAITFSPYQTWGISKQFGEKHPSWSTKIIKMLQGLEE